MTATTGFAYGNLLDTATLSGGSWDSLANLQTGHLWKPATSTDATTANTRINIDFGSAVSPTLLWIPAHNLTSAGAIQITRGTSAGASDVEDSTEITAWPFAPIDGYNGRSFGIPVFLSGAAARYLRIQLRDTTNPAGELWVSRPFVGPAYLRRDPVKLEQGWQSYSSVKRTVTGTDWRTQRAPLRNAGLVYNWMSNADDSLLHEVIRTHGTTGECVYIASNADRAVQQQFGFLALARELVKSEYQFWRYPGFAIGFEERGGAPA